MKCIFALQHAKYIECREQQILLEEQETEPSMEKETFSLSCSSEQHIYSEPIICIGEKKKGVVIEVYI